MKINGTSSNPYHSYHCQSSGDQKPDSSKGERSGIPMWDRPDLLTLSPEAQAALKADMQGGQG
ncbi:MAG: hypothetical protein AB1758_17540 [Candidatus Eremiobacterota bacterium]